jgi:hypothetical protein
MNSIEQYLLELVATAKGEEYDKVVERLAVIRDLRLAEMGEGYSFLFWHEDFKEKVLLYFINILQAADLRDCHLTIEQMMHVAILDVANAEKLIPIGHELRNLAGARAANFKTMPPEWEAHGDYGHQLVSDFVGPLTTTTLREEVAPYLGALDDLEMTIAGLKFPEFGVGLRDFALTVRHITQRSPVEINLRGAGDAIKTLKEDIVPWRREHAQRIAELKELEAEMELDRKRLEDTAEFREAYERLKRQRLENEKLQLELNRDKLQLALDIVTKLRPELSDMDKLTYAFQILPSIDTLTMSIMEFHPADERALPPLESSTGDAGAAAE